MQAHQKILGLRHNRMVLHFKINITNQEGFDQNFNMTIKALLQRQFFLPKSHFNYDLIFNYTTLKRFR